MRLDESHATVEALRRLVPEVVAAGGSFAAWLPHPQTVSQPARLTAFTSAREAATHQCVRRLVRRVGLSETIRIDSGQSGQRDWPAGFVGSLTNKGTVVLGVIAHSTFVLKIGIDLERRDRSDLAAIQDMIAPDGVLSELDPEFGLLLAFSAKEAVFKAQYPLSHRNLDFSEINLAWSSVGPSQFCASVLAPDPDLQVRCVAVGDWVLSAALAVRQVPSIR
jgi:4'-phosphopantetheinyl transferase EntD